MFGELQTAAAQWVTRRAGMVVSLFASLMVWVGLAGVVSARKPSDVLESLATWAGVADGPVRSWQYWATAERAETLSGVMWVILAISLFVGAVEASRNLNHALNASWMAAMAASTTVILEVNGPSAIWELAAWMIVATVCLALVRRSAETSTIYAIAWLGLILLPVLAAWNIMAHRPRQQFGAQSA